MRCFLAFIGLMLAFFSPKAQSGSINTSNYSFQEAIYIKKLPSEGTMLNKGWKFQAGDNPDFANPAYDDRQWQSIDPTEDVRSLPQLWKTNIGWFRLHFTIDSTLAQKSLGFLIEQTGASEIFLNGELIQQFGNVTANPHQVQGVSPPTGSFIPLQANAAGKQVLAVRFAVQKNIPYINFGGRTNPAFALQAMDMQQISRNINSDNSVYFIFMRAGLFLLLSILHIALYWLNPTQKANLYFFIYATFLSISEILMSLAARHSQLIVSKMVLLFIGLSSIYIGTLFFLVAVYKIFNFRFKFFFWITVFITFFGLVSFGFYNPYSIWIADIFVMLPLIEIIRVTLLATRARQRGATILICGAISCALFFILFNLFAFGYIPAGSNWLWGNLVFYIAWISLPVAISIYLALESSYASRTLTEKLIEVQQLSKERQQILASQKEVLEKQVEQRTDELQHSLQELKATQAQLIQSEKMASLGELTAGIAHEIQNPLNFVNNFSETNVELIQEAKNEFIAGKNEEVLKLMEDIYANEEKINLHGKRADSIVKSMLEHSRVSKGEKQPTDLNTLLDEYLRLTYHGFRAKNKNFNVTINAHFDESIGKINLVPQEIGRVLLNLFNNAFWAMNEKKKMATESYEPIITVTSKKEPNRIEITVNDNGIGIPQTVINKIFQPFFTTKPTGDGTGLGLSLSYNILKADGGELKVESLIGEGATFIIKLPA